MDPLLPLLFSLAVLSLALCGLFSMAWWTLGRETYMLVWAGAFLLAAGQWSLHMLREDFANHDYYWLLVAALGLAVLWLAYVGHSLRSARYGTTLSRMVTSGVLLVYALTIWATVVVPDRGLSMGVQPLYGGVLLILCAWLILLKRQRPLAAEWAAAVVTGVFGLNQLLAGWLAILSGVEPGAGALVYYREVNALFMPAAYASMGLFMVYMLASDQAERMRELAIKDPLTGLLNRRGLREAVERTLSHSRRVGNDVSVIICDIDHFKQVNDDLGHAAGDEVLCQFAARLQRGRRQEDLVARIGGEEFVVVLPNTAAPAATRLAKDLRSAAAAQSYVAIGKQVYMTASFGLASLTEQDDNFDILLDRADEALYVAKSAGRNQVHLAAAG